MKKKKYEALPYVSVNAAISAEHGLMGVDYKVGQAFETSDSITFIKELHDTYHDDARPLAIFADNGTYQKNAQVKKLCHDLGIELLWNLPYRPELNGIETYWAKAKTHYRRAIIKHQTNNESWNQLHLVTMCLGKVSTDEAKLSAIGGWERLRSARPIIPVHDGELPPHPLSQPEVKQAAKSLGVEIESDCYSDSENQL